VRRQRGDLIECYKILTGKENIDSHQFFHLSDNSHGLRGHSFKLSLNTSRLDLRKNFFSQASVLGTVFLSMSSTPPRLTTSRTASMLTGRPSDMDNKGSAYTEVNNSTSK